MPHYRTVVPGTVFARVALGEQRDLRIIPSRVSIKEKKGQNGCSHLVLYAILVDTARSVSALVSEIPNDARLDQVIETFA